MISGLSWTIVCAIGILCAQKPPVVKWNFERQKPLATVITHNMPPVYDGWFLTDG